MRRVRGRWIAPLVGAVLAFAYVVGLLVATGGGTVTAGAAPVRAVALPAAEPEPRVSDAPPAPAEPVRVSLFGDSLAHEAKGAFALEYQRRATAVDDRNPKLQTFPAMALCDFRRQITTDLLARRPGVLVLEFSGNSGTACMGDDETGGALAIGSEPWRDRYLDDLRAILAIARSTDTTIVWATAPPLSLTQFASNYPADLAAAVRRLARGDRGLRVVDSGAALAGADAAFARTLPCREDEQAYCGDGQLVVRADDGLHFDCHGVQGPMGECLGYSAGARRFGEAIAAATVAATNDV
jgi:hypothetical protein